MSEQYKKTNLIFVVGKYIEVQFSLNLFKDFAFVDRKCKLVEINVLLYGESFVLWLELRLG